MGIDFGTNPRETIQGRRLELRVEPLSSEYGTYMLVKAR